MRIDGMELTWWDENGGNSIDLEPYQMWAIHQILGMTITPTADGDYAVSFFDEATVLNRVKKAGILVEKNSRD